MILAPRSLYYAGKFLFVQFLRWVTGKPFFVDTARENVRLQTCLKCDKYSAGQCQICTCFIPLKVKWIGEYCPENPPKWK